MVDEVHGEEDTIGAAVVLAGSVAHCPLSVELVVEHLDNALKD